MTDIFIIVLFGLLNYTVELTLQILAINITVLMYLG